MGLLDSLYQQLILEHYKRPRNYGALAGATRTQEGLNPSCGDELKVHLKVTDGVLEELRFEGSGCAISQASASLMTEVVKGLNVEDAKLRVGAFKAMLRGDAPSPDLGDAQVLAGVAKLPARVKCATLAWVTLEQALEHQHR